MAKFTKEYSSTLKKQDAEEYRDQRFTKNPSLVKLDQREKQCVRTLLKLVPQKSLVLDIPCGAGRFHELMREFGLRLIAADISEEMVELSRAKGLAEKYFVADAEKLQLEDKSVDCVSCIRLFHHIDSERMRRNIFKEFARVSKRWVLMSFYHSNCLKRFKKIVRGKSISGEHVSYSTLRADAASAGLRPVKTAAVSRYIRPQWFVLFEVKPGVS